MKLEGKAEIYYKALRDHMAMVPCMIQKTILEKIVLSNISGTTFFLKINVSCLFGQCCVKECRLHCIVAWQAALYLLVLIGSDLGLGYVISLIVVGTVLTKSSSRKAKSGQ